MAVALLVAGGRGERLGSQTPKALVELAGRPMLAWSLDALLASDGIEEIVVALPAGVEPAEVLATVQDVGAGKRIGTVSGGSQRSHSVRNALDAAGRAEIVLVHDAARPLVTAQLVDACLAALDEDGEWHAAIAAAPVTDTIKRSLDGLAVSQTLARSELWAVQTPQVFRRAALERALARPDEELAKATDEAMLVESDGGRVRIVHSPAPNLKVTTVQDLMFAGMLLEKRSDA